MRERKSSYQSNLIDVEGGAGIPLSPSPSLNSSFDDSKMSRLPFGISISMLRDTSDLPWTYILAVFGISNFLSLMLLNNLKYFILVWSICGLGFAFSFWLFKWVVGKDTGTDAMMNVAIPIREGAESFLSVQYQYISRIGGYLMVCIFISYLLRPQPQAVVASEGGAEVGGFEGIDNLSTFVLGILASISFVIGAVCSGFAGYAAMWVAAQANVRVASAAQRSFNEALKVCFRAGAFSAVLVISLCVGGLSLLFGCCYLFFGTTVGVADTPLLIVGYGFGASFVALFMQLGGGIFTKAADVGADLVGKVEQGIPEDDPRNPAVIADLVGDMVGDCVGSSADIFESIAAEIIGAMILGGVLAKESSLENPLPFIFFPIVVHAFDIIVSSVAIMTVKATKDDKDPMEPLKRGYLVSVILAFLGFIVTTRWLLYSPAHPTAWFHYLGCGLVGVLTSYVFVLSTAYFTDYKYYPVQSIAKASMTGHGTNIITGVSVGMKSTVVPVLAVSVGVISSYWIGRTSGMGEGHNAGLFGTAVATMGMLSSAVYVLAMNNYGPIADNAGGIAEMSGQPDSVRDITDQLDAAGNVTKAITKGYSIGSAALACFVLFGAIMDDFAAVAGERIGAIDLGVPEILIAGLLGVMMIFYFVGLSVAAVGDTASEVVVEVRRQFKADPGIMEGTSLPDYRTCIALVTRSALREMRFPGLLAVSSPVVVGLVFRFIGSITGRPYLGAQALGGFLMFSTVSGILMALFLDNVGGAWDNAKKFVELGNYGGKGSEAHKASITGDTVGDPFKDTAGPALHVVIKLLSTTILVLAPLFISKQ